MRYIRRIIVKRPCCNDIFILSIVFSGVKLKPCFVKVIPISDEVLAKHGLEPGECTFSLFCTYPIVFDVLKTHGNPDVRKPGMLDV